MSIKKIVKSVLLNPPFVKHSSQTLYQALLGCLKLYEATGTEYWKGESQHVCSLLLEAQRPDGGFDIAYDFNFGQLHKKGDSTSPEMVGLVAFNEYRRVFGGTQEIDAAIKNAKSWVVNKFVEKGEKKYLPYSPYNTDEQMVYNGSSFAIGGLGSSVSLNESEQKVYTDVVGYLSSVVSEVGGFKGKVFYYYDQDRSDLDSNMKSKIDLYHQAQQIEMHVYANNSNPDEHQLVMIKSLIEFLYDFYLQKGMITYTFDNKYFGGHIHVWGFSSLIPAFLMCAELFPECADKYKKVAKEAIDWLLKYSLKKDMFLPILDVSGTPVYDTYMVRSDAWVFNAISSSIGITDKKEDIIITLEGVYKRMKACDFSGKESHASNVRTRIISKFLSRFI